jgi:hypothetical protein
MTHDTTGSARKRKPDSAKIKIKGSWTAIPNRLLTDRRLSRDARLLGCLIFMHAANSGKAFPGQEDLAAELSFTARVVTKDPDTNEKRISYEEREITVRSVQRWLTELRDSGWLRWRQTLKNNEYTLLDPDDRASPENDSESDSSHNNDLTGATAESSGATEGSHGDATEGSPRATAVSRSGVIEGSAPMTEESCQATEGSPPLIPLSPSTLFHVDSLDPDSLDQDSAAAEAVPIHHPAAAAAAADPVVAYLGDLGVTAAQEFAGLDLDAVEERVARIQRNPEWRPSDITTSLRKYPPRPVPRDRAGSPTSGPIDLDRYRPGGAYGDLFRMGSDTSDLDLDDADRALERGHQ